MKLKMTNEAKTGLLVLICVLALGALLLKVGNFSLMRKGFTLKSRLNYTAGVKKHAPVRLSGVDIGEVEAINVIYGDETIVELSLRIDEGSKIRLDSKAYVTTLGLMGEKYIEIKAGTSKTDYAKDGDTILAQDPVRLEELVQMGTQVAGQIGKMADDISKVAQHVDGAVVDNKPKVDGIFNNFEETSENFRDFSQDIKYHPWKVLAKGHEKSKEEMERDRLERQKVRDKILSEETAASSTANAPKSVSNFSVKRN